MQHNTTLTQSLAQTVQKSTMAGAPIPCSGTARTSDFYSIFRFNFLVISVADFTKVHTMRMDPLPSVSLVIASKVFQPVEQSSPLLKVLCCSNWLKAFFEQKTSLSSFAFGFRFSTLIVFPGVNPNPNPRAKVRKKLTLTLTLTPFILTSFEDFRLEVFDDTHLLHLLSGS